MNTHAASPTPAPTTTADAASTGAAVVPVSQLVDAGLRRVAAALRAVPFAPPGDAAARAARARRLAELHTRRARWWAVLDRATVADHTIPLVYIQAVVLAVGAAEREAQFWTDAAADWQARAEQRPTSDVAGAMSNWDELGLTEPPAPGLANGALR